MKVNGTTAAWSEGLDVATLLRQEDYDATRVVVEINQQIIPHRLFTETFVSQEDTIEVIRFVGGG